MEQTREIRGTIVGLIYLWLEDRASIYLWIVGIIMPAIYLVVYYEAGLYADVGINAYYLLAAIYGWIMWKYGKTLRQLFHKTDRIAVIQHRDGTPAKEQTEALKEELPISHIPLYYLPGVTLVFAGAFVCIAWILIYCTDSTVPWMDSFITALSIIGMWMLARKYVEQWLVWIVVDVVASGLYFYKGLEFTAGLYALYAIIAIFGYFKWKKLMSSDERSVIND